MSKLFYNFAADNKKKGPIMSVTALQNVWEGLLAYNLSTANKRWLAERLWEQAESEESDVLEPYTTEEINSMLFWLNKVDNSDWMPTAIRMLSLTRTPM